jgi:hypothetical protein
MTYQGKVQGGVVVLSDGMTLPEGAEVMVVLRSPELQAESSAPRPDIWDKMKELARWAQTQPCNLPEDFAANHDHYLHGQPKRS